MLNLKSQTHIYIFYIAVKCFEDFTASAPLLPAIFIPCANQPINLGFVINPAVTLALPITKGTDNIKAGLPVNAVAPPPNIKPCPTNLSAVPLGLAKVLPLALI